MSFKDVFSKVGKAINTNSPVILTGIGVVGVITTAVLASKASITADFVIKEHKKKTEHHPEYKKDINKDLAIDLAKLYWPTLLSGGLTITAIICSNRISSRRQAALAAAYNISEKALVNYQDKVTELLGEKEAKKVKDAVAKKAIEDNPVSDNQVIITNGTTLCYDDISGRYFNADPERLRQIMNEINSRLLTEHFISLNEFYYEIDLKPIRIGQDLGWHLEDGTIELSFSAHVSEDNRPVLVLEYSVTPRPRGRDYYGY